jgi:hypothetical protein
VIGYFLLGLALLVGAVLLIQWFVQADPKQVLRIAKWVAVGFAIALMLLLVFFGRTLMGLLFLLPVLIPAFLRWRLLWRRLKSVMGPTPGQSSEVVTRFLRMSLDHDSGAMSGTVLEGRFAGRGIDRMSLPDLLELWHECLAMDEQSASVLEAYLDRSHGESWREAADEFHPGGRRADGAGASGGAAGGGAMSRDEAYEILGLAAGASEREIREAHHRLLLKIHPDHGGSNYLAAKINQAKDLLLRP